MKGVLFNVVEDVVVDQFSEEVWDDVLQRAELAGAYTTLGNYPDDDLTRIVGAVCEITGLDVGAVLRFTGQHAFAHLVGRRESLLEGIDSWPELLDALDSIIHPEVMKIYPGAQVPSFTVTGGGERVCLEYRSERGLCELAEGLALGAADWYAETVTSRHVACARDGAEACLIEFVRAEPQADA